MFRHPPERHAFEVAEKQGWIADRGEAAADVGHDENEEDDVVRR